MKSMTMTSANRLGPEVINADDAIAARVRRYREWACLSQAQAARELGISQQTLRRYESGDREIGGSTLFAMSVLYEISVGELFPRPPLHHGTSGRGSSAH